MTTRRSDTEEKLHFRSDRFSHENGVFFFSTREGTQQGPYRTHKQAELAADLYVREHQSRILAQRDPHPYRYADQRLGERRASERRIHERRQQSRRTS